MQYSILSVPLLLLQTQRLVWTKDLTPFTAYASLDSAFCAQY
jgi:hypothetical protein